MAEIAVFSRQGASRRASVDQTVQVLGFNFIDALSVSNCEPFAPLIRRIKTLVIRFLELNLEWAKANKFQVLLKFGFRQEFIAWFI